MAMSSSVDVEVGSSFRLMAGGGSDDSAVECSPSLAMM